MIKLDSKTGFDTPKELIDYCEEHCQSQRALFNGAQIFDMIRLAGFPDGYGRPVAQSFGQFFPMHEDMAELCKLARARIAAENDLGPQINAAMYQNGRTFAERILQETTNPDGSLGALKSQFARLDVTPFYQGIRDYVADWEQAREVASDE